jgi:hypothetical protein
MRCIVDTPASRCDRPSGVVTRDGNRASESIRFVSAEGFARALKSKCEIGILETCGKCTDEYIMQI